MLKRKREEYKIIKKKLPRKEAFFVGKELIEMVNSSYIRVYFIIYVSIRIN